MEISNFYAQLKNDLIAWAKAREDIRVILQVGSRARKVKPGDDYADLDLSVFHAGKSSPGLIEDCLKWLKAYAPVWAALEDRHDDSPAWLILYRGGIKVDVDFSPVASLKKLIAEQALWDDQSRGYEVLLDKDGLGDQLPLPRYFEPTTFNPPSGEAFLSQVEAFYYGAVFAAKQIKRNNLWRVKWADQYQQRALLEMLEWHAHAASRGPVETWSRGDFMQDWVSGETWEALHGVFGRFDAADSRQALLASVGLYTRLAQETAENWGYPLPGELIAEVRMYLEDLLALV